MLFRVIISFAIVLGSNSSSDATNEPEETWILTGLREKDTNQTIQIPPEDYIQLSFHGDNCLTVKTKCSSHSGIYVKQTGHYLRKDILSEFIIVRAMLEIHRACSTDFFRDEVEKFSEIIVINQREHNLLEIHSHDYLLFFERGKSIEPLSCVDRCSLIPDGGVCRALYSKYYFDQAEQRCKQFNWGGCSGTVPFETLEECRLKCSD